MLHIDGDQRFPDLGKAVGIWYLHWNQSCDVNQWKIIRRVFPLIAFSFTILITIFLIHGLFNHENATLLFAAGPIRFYREGVQYAARISCNVLNMLLAFAVFVLTTKPVELVEDMERAGFSPKIGYVISSVFQIVPQMSGTMNTIMDAQRSRGLETEGSLITRAKSFLPLISPVVMSSLIIQESEPLHWKSGDLSQERRKLI